MIHGLGGSSRWWCRNIETLAEHFQVMTLDLTQRRHWVSGRDRLRLSETADVLAEWLTLVGIDRAHVVGHSLGGQMALRLAAAHPERVDRLVLIAPAALPLGHSLGRLALRAVGPVPERTAEFTRIVVGSTLRTNPLVVIQTAYDLVQHNVALLIKHVTAPTLLVWGERDPMVPIGHAAQLQSLLPDTRLLVVPGAGHNPMYYHAAIFNATVLEFLRQEPGVQAQG